MNSLREYFDIEAQLFSRIPYDRVDRLVALLERARTQGQSIFLFGNGGSAATASHFACDLGKGTVCGNKPRFKVITFNDNMATFSAYANDQGYDSVFAEPLLTFSRPGDIAITFTGSGNSPNVVRAMQVAGAQKLVTVALTGFDGGQVRKSVDLEINVPCDLYPVIEDVHLALTHAICEMLKIDHG